MIWKVSNHLLSNLLRVGYDTVSSVEQIDKNINISEFSQHFTLFLFGISGYCRLRNIIRERCKRKKCLNDERSKHILHSKLNLCFGGPFVPFITNITQFCILYKRKNCLSFLSLQRAVFAEQWLTFCAIKSECPICNHSFFNARVKKVNAELLRKNDTCIYFKWKSRI